MIVVELMQDCTDNGISLLDKVNAMSQEEVDKLIDFHFNDCEKGE